MDGVLTLQEAVFHSLVVDQVLHRFHHLRIGQNLVFLVEGDVHQTSTQLAVDRDTGLAGHPGNVFRVEVAGDIDIAFFQQQALGSAFPDVANHDALHCRRSKIEIRVGDQRDRLVGLPAAQLIGAGAGGVVAQPGVAQVAINLVCHDQLAVDDTADGAGQAVQHKRKRIAPVGGDLQGHGAGCDDGLFDVVGVEAELREDERRCLVQGDGAAQAELGVLRGHRVARMEFDAFAHLEGDGFSVVGHRPAFRQVRAVARIQVIRVEIDQFPVDIAADITARELKRLGRIKRRDVVDLSGDDQHVGRRLGDCRYAYSADGQHGGCANSHGSHGYHCMSPVVDS